MKSRKSFINIVENNKGSKAHKEAIAMGLQYSGFGYWKDPQTGETTHKTEDDQLVPVEAEEQAEKAGEGAPEGPGGIPGGPGAPSPMDAGKGATQQPKGPGSTSLGQKVGPAPEPGDEQDLEDRKNWTPGPDGDSCLDGTHAPGDIPDDSFVGKTNYYQWTAGPDGTNYMNVSYDSIMKAAKEQRGNQTAQAPPGGMQEETEPARPHPGAGTMMRQVMGAQKGAEGRTINNAASAVKKMRGDSDDGVQRALGNQVASMMRIRNRGKDYKGQSTWNAEYGKKADMWRKALKLPAIAKDADAVKMMNKEAKNLVKDPNFDMSMDDVFGEGDFGQVGTSTSDPNIVVKKGMIGPDELKALHAFRDNPRFPTLINAEFSSPFLQRSSEYNNPVGADNDKRKAGHSQYWDPDDQSDDKKFPGAEGTYAMTRAAGVPLNSFDFGEDVYTEEGSPMMEKLQREIWGLRGTMHRLGFSHNDMHGGNVFVDEDGNPSIIDLGLAKDNPLSALMEAMGGMSGEDYQMSDDFGFGNLPQDMRDRMEGNLKKIRDIIRDGSDFEDDDDFFESRLEDLTRGGIRHKAQELADIEEDFPFLGDRQNVLDLVDRLYDGVGGSELQRRMANAFQKRKADTAILKAANKLRKDRGEKAIENPRGVVPPKNLDFDD